MSASEAEPQLQIGHVLILDVVEYSKLLIDKQTAVMAELNDIVRGTVRFRVADAADKLIRLPMGDGMALVFFGDPEAALECALEIATELKKHREIQVRMGIHSGPVNKIVDLNEQPNVAGAGIDIAQRVMDCGDAGHILLSKRIAYDLAPSPRWNANLYELGECEVKHGQKIALVNFCTEKIGNPDLPAKIKRAREEVLAHARRSTWWKRGTVAAAALLLLLAFAGGIFLYRRHFAEPPPSVSAPPEKSIAVLPFVDLSQARDQEYFCDGISEEILDALAKVDGLRVVARTSSFSFKGKGADANEIARKLNVATVLEGSLRRDGDRIRITTQLINARDGFHIWSETFERELKGVFAVQDEITRAIVDALKIKLAVAPRPRMQQNTEAYDLYLQGLYFSNKSSEAELRKSLDFFQRALEKDPRLGRAWTGIAKDWDWLADAFVRPAEAYPNVERAAGKALAFNERDAEALCYLAEGKRVMAWNVKGSAADVKRALEIDPNSAVAHFTMALLQSSQGHLDEGLAHMKTAVRLDPLSPIIGTFEVALYVTNDRLDDAFAAAKRTMEIDPDYVYFEPNLALVYREQGKLKEALEIYSRLENARHQPTAGLGITYAKLKRPDDARKVLRQLIDLANTKYFPGEQIASVYVALGDKDEAIHWIERAIAEHSGSIHSIPQAREFRPLHSDPRFVELERRIGIDRPDR